MSNASLGSGSFHLAYVPAVETSTSVSNADKSTSASSCVVSDSIVIRKATSLRLYRCRGTNGRDSQWSAAIADQQRNGEECHCCCCRADKCTPDSLLAVPDCRKASHENEACKNTMSFCEPSMLAVLVPPSLTRDLTDIYSKNVNVDGEMEHDGTEVKQRLVDAEIELKKSIHPCLVPANESLHPSHSERVEFNPECEVSSGQKYRATEENTKPQLFVRGIITSNDVSRCVNFPADAVLLAPAKASTTSFLHNGNTSLLEEEHILSYYSNLLNHDTVSDAPWSVIKAFPISTLSPLPMEFDATNKSSLMNIPQNAFDAAALPCCPVCLNLIEPKYLGLPELKPQQRSSQFCSSSLNFRDNKNRDNYFSGQQQGVDESTLRSWPPQLECTACAAFQENSRRAFPFEVDTNATQRSLSTETAFLSPVECAALQMNHQTLNTNINYFPAQSSYSSALTCHQCNMSNTLWVCLTCGVVGCSRYTLKHAAQHNALKGHPFSLELATGRIWDYENGIYVHRRDLVESNIALSGANGSLSASIIPTPSSVQRVDRNSFSENGNHGDQRNGGHGDGLNQYRHHDLEDSTASCHNDYDQNLSLAESKLSSQPKKSIMINEEYEALLQSALEDQSQHYEGEICRLKAELATSRMEDIRVPDKESCEIRALQQDIHRLKQDVICLSSVQVQAQVKEAKHRSISQRLLREQTIAKELLEKIRKEIATENDSGKEKAEDLEMQITDLTANIKLQQTFATNNELSQAQICGTIGGSKEVKLRGKKSRRGRKNDNGIRDALLYYFVASSHLLLESHPPKISPSMGNDASSSDCN